MTNPVDLIRLPGMGCYKCRQSSGERLISIFLDGNSINYTSQKRFDTCRNKKTLPFDFYLPLYNILIEFDGKQHFKPVKCWGGKSKLHSQQKNDKIKSDWAYSNNIKLIRISYEDITKINDILSKEISQSILFATNQDI